MWSCPEASRYLAPRKRVFRRSGPRAVLSVPIAATSRTQERAALKGSTLRRWTERKQWRLASGVFGDALCPPERLTPSRGALQQSSWLVI
eukprot:6201417-Pleurochrysis_carterae.AAC.2